MFNAIVLCDSKYGIAKGGTIPWYIKEDLQYFKSMTTDCVCIMGRKTFDDVIKNINQPLPDRINIVISSTMTKEKFLKDFNDAKEKWKEEYSEKKSKKKGKKGKKGRSDNSGYTDEKETPFDNLFFVPDVISAVKEAKKHKKEKFVIGGEGIYKYFMNTGLCEKVYFGMINKDFKCDKFFPRFVSNWRQINTKKHPFQRHVKSESFNGIIYYSVYQKFNNEERQFINLMADIMEQPEVKCRNGVIKSVFGKQLEFSLLDNVFPLMTTKRLPLRLIFEELMFILRGQTDTKILEEKKVFIWKDNTTREFLDLRGLTHLPEGDMGPSYGFQLRHFGAEYKTCKDNYDSQGVDQLTRLIKNLKEDPMSRRHIITYYNPADVDKAPLPSCLYEFQFHVEIQNEEMYLSCKAIQRSSDVAVASGWNVASASLLTILLAHVVGMKPKKLIWSVGNAHIYDNHYEGVKEQLARNPKVFPIIVIKNSKDIITSFEYKDLELINYNPSNTIKFKMNP